MITYWQNYHSDLTKAMMEHLQLVLTSLSLALVISILLLLFFVRQPNWLNRMIYFFSVLYSIPSYAFFALLIPLTGLGFTTAIIVLTLYSEYILLRNFMTGIQAIDSQIIESATAMGMTGRQVFLKIQLPLATKSIFSGIRLAITAIIGIATIAATINAGGLGTILFDGLRTQSIVKIVWGTILTIILCLIVTVLLKLIEKIVIKTIYLEG